MKVNGRMHYLDYLRVFLTVLVILHHTAIAYGAGGSWIYEDVDKSELTISMIILTIFTAVNQSFFMGLFFFLSGYFIPGAYTRKGPRQFFKDRFIRLGIPLLVYIFVLGPAITYFAHFSDSMSLLTYYQREVLTFNTIHIGPLWFVEALLIFNILYGLCRSCFLKKSAGRKLPFPNTKKLILLAVLLGITAFAVRLFYPVGTGPLGLQFGYFPSYIFLFAAGIMAFHYNWLDDISLIPVKKWLLAAAFTIPVLPIGLVLTGALEGNMAFEGGLTLQAFIYAMWEPFVAFGLIITLLNWFHDKYNKPDTFGISMSQAAYTVYIIHPAIIVGLSLFFTAFPIHPFIKFLIVGSIGTILCFASASLIIKIPYAKRVL
ncbi:acyltransferase family protein [Peribacillus glennii]|uniref:Acyltransferase n=1 Tax=Peribacillus glennii TaxID=2303991 RepID=A0A372L832_9BACI|nr:acyltransferase family protein [Peribacillus glennii]RFU61152.1 acyltransferase [Peribacillus glennii]